MAELATNPDKHDKLEPGKSKVNDEMIKFLKDFIDEITASFELQSLSCQVKIEFQHY